MHNKNNKGTEFPILRLDHLIRLTDSTGIIQHARYTLPDFATGYTTDDNARALVLALRLLEPGAPPVEMEKVLELAERYMSFLVYVQRPDGKFHNFVHYTRDFADEEGSEDAFGRAMLACAYAMTQDNHKGISMASKAVWDRAARWISKVCSPRGKAHLILAVARLLTFQRSRTSEVSEQEQPLPLVESLTGLADGLVRQYRAVSARDWQWFEDYLTYSNGIMPEALFWAYRHTGNQDYLDIATESLEFLTWINFRHGKLKLVGNHGWYFRGRNMGQFDEQPVDAAHMVEAYAAAYRATGEEEYQTRMIKAFEWFLGKNILGVPVYDEETGGCHDGLTPSGPNLNEGAESLLSYLLSYVTVYENLDEARIAEKTA
ncbi:MAG: glycosyltransferase [Firmicutes bacterium]|nr:glycosyltransferase [Bacillota bacterium]